MMHDIPAGIEPPRADLRRVLTRWDGVALIAGIMIGSGIFATPPQIAGSLDHFGPMIAVWLLGGVLAICGALTYAELSAMFPRTGGAVVFIEEAYGRGPAFVFGWSTMLITYPASIAAIAVVFGAYFKRLFPALGLSEGVIAAGLVALVCIINMLGVVLGARVQRTFTGAKVAALCALIGFALISDAGNFSNLSPLWAVPSGGWQFAGIAIAMASVLWTFEGWAEGATLAGETCDRKRDVPSALIIGTLMVTVLYLLINTAYVYVMSIPGIAASGSIAVDMAERTMGQYGALFVNLMVLVSTAGAVNGSVISGSRVSFAIARDGLMFAPVGRVHKRFKTPAVSLSILGTITIFYCLIGTFDELIRYFVFVAMIWFFLTIGSVFVQRVRRPDAPRPFRVPGYPVTPAIFLLVALGLLMLLFKANQRDSLISLGILAASFPVFWVWRRVYRRSESVTDDREH